MNHTHSGVSPKRRTVYYSPRRSARRRSRTLRRVLLLAGAGALCLWACFSLAALIADGPPQESDLPAAAPVQTVDEPAPEEDNTLRIAVDAGKHVLSEQTTPRKLNRLKVPKESTQFDLDINYKLMDFLGQRLTQLEPFNGLWNDRPEECRPGERYWCPGNIDGAVNFIRNMPEWSITISLFEVNEYGSAQPILGVVHAPALDMTYMAVRGMGAIRVRKTPIGDKREKIIPSTTPSLDGSVVSFGMSYVQEESMRALQVVSAIAGRPTDIKRVGPVSLDLCKVADGTYDAYFEPHLHTWDVPAVSAGAVVVWESQAKLRQWNGTDIHWRSDNDVVASNGIIINELRPYLIEN